MPCIVMMVHLILSFHTAYSKEGLVPLLIVLMGYCALWISAKPPPLTSFLQSAVQSLRVSLFRMVVSFQF